MWAQRGFLQAAAGGRFGTGARDRGYSCLAIRWAAPAIRFRPIDESCMQSDDDDDDAENGCKGLFALPVCLGSNQEIAGPRQIHTV